MKSFFPFLSLLTILYIGCNKKSDQSENKFIVPLIPDELYGNVISNEQIEISWINKTNIDYCDNINYDKNWLFIIEREDDKEKAKHKKYYCKNDISNFIDKGLIGNTTYTYRIYFENGSNKTPVREITLKTPSLPNKTLIGQQTWQTKNLDVTTYNDGTEIYQVTSLDDWENVQYGAWCYYEFDSKNAETYGKLYNGYALLGIYDEASLHDPNLRKNIAPDGWRIPSVNDFKVLIDFLGGESKAGGKLKKTGNQNDHMSAQWVIAEYLNLRNEPSKGKFKAEFEATNETLFSALPCGYGINTPKNKMYYKNFKFFDLCFISQMWCVVNEEQKEASTLILNKDSNWASFTESKIVYPNGDFYSIRCIKN